MDQPMPILRHPRTPDLLGYSFERWTVTAFAGYRAWQAYWVCTCACGTVKERAAHHIQDNKSRSCGCFRHDMPLAPATTHGMTHTPEYRAWRYLLRDCTPPQKRGLGSTVCDAWRDSFAAFYADMGPRPTPKHILDRYPDRHGVYAPENCRWITRHDAAHPHRPHTRSWNRWITYQGLTRTLTEWADSAGLPLETLRYRLAMQWTIDDALHTPVRPHRAWGAPPILTCQDVTQPLVAWARQAGMAPTTLRRRLLRGESLENTLARTGAQRTRRKASDGSP